MFRLAAKIVGSPYCYRSLERSYAKDMRFNPEARALFLQEIDSICDAAIDSVTMAKSITVVDKFQNVAANLVQTGAKNTKKADDGARCSAVLERAIARNGFAKISCGASPIQIRQGLLTTVELVVEQRRNIAQAATISENYDKEIGDLSAEEMKQFGRDDIFIVKEGKSLNDPLELIEVVKLDRGNVSSFFQNAANGHKFEFQNALVLVTEQKLSEIKSVLPVLDVANSQQRPLLIIADDVEGEALRLLLINRFKIGRQIAAVKAGLNRPTLEDIANSTGATVLCNDGDISQVEDVTINDLGEVGGVIITKNNDTMMLSGVDKKQDILKRVNEIGGRLLAMILYIIPWKVKTTLKHLQAKLFN